MIKVFIRIVFITCIGHVIVSAAGTCNAAPKCVCEFPDGKTLPIEPNTAGNEALAGTVGALSSLIATGSGFGIWYICKKRSQAAKLGRSSLSHSDQSYDPNNPPPYSELPRKRPESVSTLSQEFPRQESVRNTNVYRIGSRMSSAHYQGARSDWM
ncbi:uncharacterized protein LOC132562953 [Ylistrum balloti]|uniref:uncharacterized protein LOC132562953 n=1 Tax=Ylistrum balloti TaxID=509963 RepID=UPI002905A77C|nr:uncharacterized protein LOC132562953 [Ylistrum balloti]